MKTLIKTIMFAAGTLLATISGMAADKAALDTHYLAYHTAAKAVVEMAINKQVNVSEVEKKVKTMLEEGLWFCGEYAKAFPQGAKLLKVITDNVDQMKKLSFKDLEHEWHDLHHFDHDDKDIGLDVKSEANEHYTDPIHSIVHPLLVLKAAQAFATSSSAEDLKSIKEEMEEGLEQVGKQRDTLSKK